MARAVDIIAANGVENAASIVRACKRLGLEVAIGAAVIQKEGHGLNQYGHDRGGVFSSIGMGKPADNKVTEANFQDFYRRVLNGGIPNGVGPAQITYAGEKLGGRRDGGFFRLMLERGLKPWEPEDNIYFGLELINGYVRASGGNLVAAGLAYNGSESYGVELASRVQTWRRLLAGATDDVEPYQPGVVKPKGNDLKKMSAA